MAPDREEEKQEEPEIKEDVMEQGAEGEANDGNVEDVAKGEQEEEGDPGNKKQLHMKVAADAPWKDRMWEVFTTFWPLGLVRRRLRLSRHVLITLTETPLLTLALLSSLIRLPLEAHKPMSPFCVITW